MCGAGASFASKARAGACANQRGSVLFFVFFHLMSRSLLCRFMVFSCASYWFLDVFGVQCGVTVQGRRVPTVEGAADVEGSCNSFRGPRICHQKRIQMSDFLVEDQVPKHFHSSLRAPTPGSMLRSTCFLYDQVPPEPPAPSTEAPRSCL